MDFQKRTEDLKALLGRARQKQVPLGLGVTMNAPALVELSKMLGYSWILIDMEHTELALSGLLDIMRASEATGLPWFVKLPNWNEDLARDVLDFGAYGLLVGFIETADQLRDMYRAMHFPPDGRRGWCSIARSVDHFSYLMQGQRQQREEYFKFTRNHALLIPTIETVAGCNNVDELMKVEECPVWYISADDLGLDLLGADAPFDDDYAKEVYKLVVAVERKIHKAGRLLSTVFNPFPGQRKKGVDDLALLDSDMPYIMDSWAYSFGLLETKSICEEFRARKG